MIDYTTGKLIRIGCDSRIIDINLSNNNIPRNWDYQKPPSEIKPQFLSGKSKKFIYPHPTNHQEISPFRKIKIHPQPDSRRTLITEYAPINFKKPLKKKSDINFFTSVYNCEIQKKKRGNPNIYNNNFSLDNKDNHKFLNINPDPDFYEDLKAKKRQLKTTVYKKYNNASQIKYLPGGIKRRSSEINDDKYEMIKLQNEKTLNGNKLFADKYIKDYCSNIACLSFNKTQKLVTKYENKYKNKNQTEKKIKRPRSSYNYLKRNYKNKESIMNFDMLKPSDIFQKKYQPRVLIF